MSADVLRQRKIDHDRITNQVDKWPAWPILPMKRPSTTGHGWPDVGVITADYPNIVIHVNMFEIDRIKLVLHQLQHEGGVDDSTGVKVSEYMDVWAMLDDGWKVD